MTLDQLRMFIAVAEREHVTAASRALNVSQSAVSASIAALEGRHRVKLFHRVGRGVALTEAGQVFLGEARAVLARVAQAELALSELGDLKRGTLHLVASQTIAAYWLPSRLTAFRDRYPGVTVDLAIGNTGHAAALVKDGAVELGFVEGKVDDPLLAQWELGQDRLMLVQAGSLAGAAIDDQWLRSARWIMREPGSGTRSTFDAAMRARGLDPADLDVALVLPSNESVRTAIEAGAGVGALSALVTAQAVAAGTLRGLPLDLGRRPFFGLRLKERYRSRAAEALLQLIKDQASSYVI